MGTKSKQKEQQKHPNKKDIDSEGWNTKKPSFPAFWMLSGHIVPRAGSVEKKVIAQFSEQEHLQVV